MHVADVMTARPVTLGPGDTVADARRLSRLFGVQHLVIEQGRVPVGMVCVRCDLADAKNESSLAEFMTPPVTIGAYEHVKRASDVMCTRGIGALIVRGGENGWGIATRGDLLRHGYSADEREGRFFCAACGTHCHVRPVPDCQTVAFCSDCWDRAAPPRFGEDLGDSS